jgi:hypothetical protein
MEKIFWVVQGRSSNTSDINIAWDNNIPIILVFLLYDLKLTGMLVLSQTNKYSSTIDALFEALERTKFPVEKSGNDCK